MDDDDDLVKLIINGLTILSSSSPVLLEYFYHFCWSCNNFKLFLLRYIVTLRKL